MSQPSRIAIEAETHSASATLFRVRIDDTRIGEHLTAAQAHLLIGEVLNRIALPSAESDPLDKVDASNNDEAAAVIRAMWNPPPPRRAR